MIADSQYMTSQVLLHASMHIAQATMTASKITLLAAVKQVAAQQFEP